MSEDPSEDQSEPRSTTLPSHTTPSPLPLTHTFLLLAAGVWAFAATTVVESAYLIQVRGDAEGGAGVGRGGPRRVGGGGRAGARRQSPAVVIETQY